MNFAEEAPACDSGSAVIAPKVLPKENLELVQSSLYPIMPFMIMMDNESNSFGFQENKPPTEHQGYTDFYSTTDDIGLKYFTPNGANFYFNSDQGSSSFDCSNFGWSENCSRTPEIFSVLSATIEDDQTQYLEDASLAKKPESSSEYLLPADENTVNIFFEELLALESEIKFFQMLYLCLSLYIHEWRNYSRWDRYGSLVF